MPAAAQAQLPQQPPRVVMVGAASEHPTWAAWHQALDAAFRGEGDAARRGFASILARNVSFDSPGSTKTRRGQRFVVEVLMSASLFFKDFRYTREIVTKRDMVLEFEARAGSRDGEVMQGAYFFSLDEEGKIVYLHVLARPLKGVELLTEHQTRHLSEVFKGHADAVPSPKL